MPTIKSEVKHNLGEGEAIKRVKDNCDWAHTFSDLHETWSGSSMEFTTSIQGVKISGTIKVTKNSLEFTGNVPLIAIPFKSWINNILRNA